jgi:RHS repeat-associated protein
VFDRDALGRPVAERRAEHWVDRSYDPAGNLRELHTSQGLLAQFGYDRAGHLTSLDAGDGAAVRFDRDESGRELRRHLPGRVVFERAYAANGLPVADSVSSPSRRGTTAANAGELPPPGATIVSRTYSWDESGNLRVIADGRWGSTEYAYDSRERIVSRSRDGVLQEAFRYDATGNLAESSHRRQPVAFSYEPGSRLIGQGAAELRYDAEGRLIHRLVRESDGTSREWRFEWDPRSQLRRVTDPDGAVWEYEYDAFGRRVAKRGPGDRTEYVWEQDRVLHIVRTSETETWLFERATHEPLLSFQKGRAHSVIGDPAGTPRELVDEAGRVVWAADYSTWGQVEAKRSEGEADCALRFAGQWFDVETGLHYNRFRFYDPSSGRYISSDPLLFAGGLNPYVYAPNPLTWIDPFGLAVERVGTAGPGVQEVATDQLHPLHNVPRRGMPANHIENIAGSLQNNGYDVSQPISATRLENGDLVITGGHHRLAAMQSLGETTVPVRIHDAADTDPVFLARMLGIGRITGKYRSDYRPRLSLWQRLRVSVYLMGWRIKNKDQVTCQ